MAIRILLAALCGLAVTNAAYDIAFGTDKDLSRYVTVQRFLSRLRCVQ